MITWHYNEWYSASWLEKSRSGSYSQVGWLIIMNYRPVSLTSVVCKQMERVITSYLRQVWDKNDWLYEGQYGFRPGYSCESQVIMVCQDIVDSMDNRQDWRYCNRFFEGLWFSSAWSAAYENCNLGRGFKGSRMGKGVPFGSHAEIKSRRAIIRGI